MKQLVLTIIAAAIAGPAFAGNAYVGGSVGRAEQKISFDGVSVSDNDTGVKLVGGYQITPAFGVEAGYAHLGEIKISSNGAAIGTKPKSFYVAATGTMAVSPVVSAFVKLGAARTKTEMYASNMYGYNSFDEKGTSVLAGVGVSYSINKQVSLVAEYEHFGKIAESDANENLKADLLSVGVRFQF